MKVVCTIFFLLSVFIALKSSSVVNIYNEEQSWQSENSADTDTGNFDSRSMRDDVYSSTLLNSDPKTMNVYGERETKNIPLYTAPRHEVSQESSKYYDRKVLPSDKMGTPSSSIQHNLRDEAVNKKGGLSFEPWMYEKDSTIRGTVNDDTYTSAKPTLYFRGKSYPSISSPVSLRRAQELTVSSAWSIPCSFLWGAPCKNVAQGLVLGPIYQYFSAIDKPNSLKMIEEVTRCMKMNTEADCIKDKTDPLRSCDWCDFKAAGASDEEIERLKFIGSGVCVHSASNKPDACPYVMTGAYRHILKYKEDREKKNINIHIPTPPEEASCIARSKSKESCMESQKEDECNYCILKDPKMYKWPYSGFCFPKEVLDDIVCTSINDLPTDSSNFFDVTRGEEEVATTMKGSTTTKEGSTTTKEGSTTTEEGSTTTKEGSTTTKEGSTTTKKGSTTTKKGSTSTKESSTTIKEGSTTIKEGSTTIKKGSTTASSTRTGKNSSVSVELKGESGLVEKSGSYAYTILLAQCISIIFLIIQVIP